MTSWGISVMISHIVSIIYMYIYLKNTINTSNQLSKVIPVFLQNNIFTY